MKGSNTTQAISREFDGLPVVDGVNELPMIVNASDIEHSERRDYAHCVFANTCRRQFESQKVVFLRTVAYVSHPDEEGVLKVHRYAIPSEVRNIIERFDDGQDIKPGKMYKLVPCTEGAKLERSRMRSTKSSKRRRAYINGELSDSEQAKFEDRQKASMKAAQTRKKDKKGYSMTTTPQGMDVRYGTGLVQFSRKY